MPKKESAGMLIFRHRKEIEFFLVHPGGPFWKTKDAGAWSIPKGELDGEGDFLKVALREFNEETSFTIPANAEIMELGEVKLKSGKVIHGYACEMDVDADKLKSNEITIEWPPRTGNKLEIPEVDRGGWFTLPEAESKINPAQIPFLTRLVTLIET